MSNQTENSSTVISIDMRSRDLMVATAAATVTEDGGLVLRQATEIGKLGGFKLPHGNPIQFEYPLVLIGADGYQAKQSTGFTALNKAWNSPGREITLVGGAGWGFYRRDIKERVGDALRCFAEPVKCHLVPKGASVRTLETGSDNSNHRTASAASVGLRLISQAFGSITLTEGQSDYSQGWSINLEDGSDYPVFAPEHQADRFTPVARTSAALRRQVRDQNSDPEQFEGSMAAVAARLILVEDSEDQPNPHIQKLLDLHGVGESELAEANRHWLDKLRAAGGYVAPDNTGERLLSFDANNAPVGRWCVYGGLNPREALESMCEDGTIITFREDISQRELAEGMLTKRNLHAGEDWADAWTRQHNGVPPTEGMVEFVSSLLG